MPSIIFMDEPTSGLDGAATVSLAKCLGLLKDTGLTIICVIHQPRWAVFNFFSHLLLLGEGGRQVYSGRTQYLVEYFTGLGFRIPAGENPADWMIDVCSGSESRYDAHGAVDDSFVCPGSLYENWQTNFAGMASTPGAPYHRGDPDLVALPILTQRRQPQGFEPIFVLTGRVFRQTDITSEIAKVLTMMALGVLGGLAGLLTNWSWNLTTRWNKGCPRLPLFCRCKVVPLCTDPSPPFPVAWRLEGCSPSSSASCTVSTLETKSRVAGVKPVSLRVRLCVCVPASASLHLHPTPFLS